MIIGIGTDILQLSRLHAWPLKRLERLSRRILTTSEIQLLASINATQVLENGKQQGIYQKAELEPMVQFLGVRWAAKEALYKAVYPHQRLRWKDIELLPIRQETAPLDEDNPNYQRENPCPKLQATFTRSIPLTINDSTIPFLTTHLSISHDAGIVLAMVIVEGT